MAQKTVAILGATGVVGTQMLQCLEERDFPVGKLVPLASERSVGKTVTFRGEQVPVQLACPEAFEGVDIVLGAAGDAQAKELMPEAVKRGATCVDNSHAFRLYDEVPLVIPEINAGDIAKNQGIIANPNCATIIGLVPVWPLHQEAHATRLNVSTYQAASGAGMPGLTELEREMACVASGEPVGQTKPFQHQLAVNLIPQIGGFNEMGYSSEEMKMQNEGRKMLHDETIRFACTCVRVPIIRSHSEAITLEFENDITPDKARELLAEAPGVVLCDDPNNGQYPMPLLTSDQDLVYVGRVRRDLSADAASFNRSLTLFCCADQVRKGAATNAVQIAELIFGLK